MKNFVNGSLKEFDVVPSRGEGAVAVEHQADTSSVLAESTSPRCTSFAQYYEHYLSLHQNKNCRRLHLLGMAIAVVVFGLILFSPWWWLCVLAPLAVYPFAWTGHLLFERNTPAAWKNPALAAIADLHMTWDIFRGKIEL